MRGAAALLALGLGLTLAPAPLLAQAYQCRMPEKLSPPPTPQRGRDAVRRVVPVAGYTLALSWSPEYCRGREQDRGQALQCSRRFGEFGFVLHGLWPEGKTAAYPQYCASPPSAVPLSVVRQTLCIMPSQALIQHQWDKHGSCMTRDPARYFRTARQLFDAVRLPDMERLSRRALTQGMLKREIAKLNPGMPVTAIAIKANNRGWLQEVRLCLGLDQRPRACPAHVRQPRGDAPLKVWRGL
jgi:ribonuclease T2